MTKRALKEAQALRRKLARQRALCAELSEALDASLAREQKLRVEVRAIEQRLHDHGLARQSQAVRRGWRTVDDAFRAEIGRLHAAGRSGAQISRVLGCSTATVSLVLGGKYPLPRPPADN